LSQHYPPGGTLEQTIRELRTQHQWTQVELANRLGVTPSTVYNWERGNWEPRASQLRQLATLFGVRMDEIKLLESGKAAA
jgi:transcriptional regulator with XRE-family HTH domain